MKLHITIDTGNAAFSPWWPTEAARILRELANKCDRLADEEANRSDPVRDLNGNKVGKFAITGGRTK